MRTRKNAFTLVEILVALAIIGILIGMLMPAVQQAREAARRITCSNNLRQVGLALQLYHDSHEVLPPGWSGRTVEGDPGWGWASQILPLVEKKEVFDRINFSLAIDDPKHIQVRETVIPVFICPSDNAGRKFMLGRRHADHEHEEEHEEEEHEHEHEGPHNVDDGEKMYEVAIANYTGVFGTREINDHPAAGNGAFFYNSKTSFADIRDGLSNTILVGERSTRNGGTTWLGVIHDAAEPFARIVGAADHSPNHRSGHFEDFSSHHSGGANFLFGDGSVKMIGSSVNLELYQATATIQGGELVELTKLK